MSQDPPPTTPQNPWPRRSWWFTAIVLVVAFLIGFVGLARVEPGGSMLGIWAAMCRAIGIPAARGWAGPQPPTVISSGVAWTRERRGQAESGNAARGAFVALNCEVCHTQTRANVPLAAPLLAGMDAAVIYKELQDFRSKKRAWGVMNAIASALSAESMADVAAYYAHLQGGLEGVAGVSTPAAGRSLRQTDATLRVIFSGDPERGIAPCAACHGPEAHKFGAPPLAGQRAAYLERQLLAFAQGTRRNDINEQMRTLASELTQEEIHAIAAFYARQGTTADGSPGATVAAEAVAMTTAQVVHGSH